jgi:hypothetical protein
MDKSAIEHFLHAIDDELAKRAYEGQRLEWYLLGRSALILRFGLNLGTKDVDLVTAGDGPELQRLAFELFGKGTPNAQRWGLYLEGVPVGLPPVPGSYRIHSGELPGPWKVLRPRRSKNMISSFPSSSDSTPGTGKTCRSCARAPCPRQN